jgi:predicted transcriptional regulator
MNRMARPKSETLTPREAEIMDVLWKLGAATAEDVRQQLAGNPHDSSVRTMLRVLINKGCVKVDHSVRPATYRAAIPQAKMRTKVTSNLLRRFFSGSAEELVQHLLEDEQLTPDQLSKLRRQYGSRAKDKGD